MNVLPVDEALPRLKQALAGGNAAVLVAPPGAGKTTRVPLALLDAPWLAGRKIVMQEPRRLAARAAARRMAATLGEPVGETVGYRVRLDTKVGPRTRIEVVTDGLFLRMLQDDPALDGIGCVIFDELHERGLETDLSFALVREAQTALREDLRVIAMSATLDPGPVSQRLGGAPVIESAGRMFPVDTRYLDREPAGRIEDAVASTVRRALADESGSALVFLPGVGEIRRVEERLRDLGGDVDVAPLYGDLSPADQDRAIAPSPAGRRKVVLATSIAETSLTIEGVRIVVDGGLMRMPRFSPRSGMTRLETVRVSQASADQRRGRAGRLEPGVCYRLWTEEAQRGLLPFTPPEILDADLAPLALELALWGASDATPALADAAARRRAGHGARPAARSRRARRVGRDHAARTGDGAAGTASATGASRAEGPRTGARQGRRPARGDPERARLPAPAQGRARRRPAPSRRHRLERQARRRAAAHPGVRAPADAARRPQRDARHFDDRRAAGAGLSRPHRPPPAGHGRALSAVGRPRRGAARRRSDGQRGVPGRGRSRRLDPGFAHLPRRADHARPRSRSSMPIASSSDETVRWGEREGAVLARRQRRLGALVLEDKPLARPDAEKLKAAMLDGVRQLGLAALPWSDDLAKWRQRVAFLRRLDESWPDLSDAALLASLEDLAGAVPRQGLAARSPGANRSRRGA